jgi:eukaryotic-like serine/threonine-protein kinase
MNVVLKIEEGPALGRTFEFSESDNLLVGREDPSSKAHVQLSPQDQYVSRHHFMFEVRPPNCMVRDNGSSNGTFVQRRGAAAWERITEALVNDGDRIRAGHTVLSVSISMPGPEAGKTFIEPVDREPAEAEMMCIRCGEPLEKAPTLGAGTAQDDDFMCGKCRAEVREEKRREAEARAGLRYACMSCACDMTALANTDGRAAEFADVALYLCQGCAEKARGIPGGTVIGGYEVLSELGRGGMGVVYKVRHPGAGRLAALKQVLPMAGANKNSILRFLREASIMATLRDPGIVRHYESGQHKGAPFFVSELVPDGNLNRFVTAEGQPLLAPTEVAPLIARALEGMAFLHAKGYVHRDIKPENILLRKTAGAWVPKITDFGLARSYEKHGGTLSRTNEYAGTLMFMPPEQITSFKQSKPTVDIYAMGVTLYFLLTARYPLNFPGPWDTKRGMRLAKDPVRMILEDMPTPVRERRRDLSPALAAVVDLATAKDAAQRYTSAREFQAALLSSQ